MDKDGHTHAMQDTVVDNPEARLLQGLLAGHPQSFEQLVRSYHGIMLRTASALIGQAQAEEVVQDAWLAAIQNLAGFEGRSSLKTWLLSIVRNQAISRLRKLPNEISLDGNVGDDMFGKDRFGNERFDRSGHWAKRPIHWHDDSPEALLSQDEFRRCLEKTLENLPENQRSALLLRDQEELTLEEICNILSVTASNIRVLVHRARVRLHAMVEHFEETGKC